ncbi:MAG: FAD-binding oxidoreductase [Patescibacteria group bacterium]|jgi:FAD/FMN-containing dehydrogenase
MSTSHYQVRKQALTQALLAAKQTGPVALKKSTSNLFRDRQQTKVKKIDVRNFNHVIAIDTTNLIAEVEGMTTYATVVAATLPHGLMPAVVPELKSITVGGATTGVGIEASSFKYGLVHETILEIEILLGNGQVLVCDKNHNADLFYGFPNSYGTFGYALKLKIKLVPVKKYVQLQHIHYTNPTEYFAAIQNVHDVDFVDGTIMAADSLYLTLGKFVATAPIVSDYTYMNIYYQSIAQKKIDYLTTADFIWRWDTDWFWCSKHFHVQNPVWRWLWGRRYLNSITYAKLSRLNAKYQLVKKSGESIIQDVEIPIEHCVEFINFFHNVIGIKPIWICPINSYDKTVTYSLYPMDVNKLYINFGFWDTVPSDKPAGYYNKLIEQMVRKLNGKKSLYSDAYYSAEEFWELYNKTVYTRLKTKYDPTGTFRNLYEKCVLKQ